MSGALRYPKRLIEVDLPIKEISAHARREKSIRHGHISTLHIWWARRPLAACRAVICAALWPDPANENCPRAFREAAARVLGQFAEKTRTDRTVMELCQPHWSRWSRASSEALKAQEPACWPAIRHGLLDFIADFANWDASTVPAFLEAARALTQAAHEALGGAPGTKPLVVDPFAGGGSIPLEALRVGADAFASDLNPVAVLLNKVVLEYIPKYGQRLADEVRKWGEQIKKEAEKELAEFYPRDPDGATPIAYLWGRTIRCEGPGCGAEVPLFRSACLAQKGEKSVFLRIKPNQRTKRIEFELVTGSSGIGIFPSVLRRSSVTCPVCGYTTPAANVRNQFKERRGGTEDARLLAVVTTMGSEGGRRYRLASRKDVQPIHRAAEELQRIRSTALADVPDESLPYLRSIFNIQLLDVTKWSSLFTPRQLFSLITLTRLIRGLEKELEGVGADPSLRVATMTCLALAVDRVAAQFSSLSWWQPKGEFVVGTFGRQALGIVWDFAEIRPVGGASGDLDGAIQWVLRVIENAVGCFSHGGTVGMASATKHPLPNDSAVAVITDPPYYDAVPYADLSDFFYVFLRRMLGSVHANLFEEELTPKEGEVVQLAERNPIYAYKTREYFEDGMREALSEAKRVTVADGIGVVVFAHKTTQGWEVLLSSLMKAGWIVTASWPIDTERAVRMRASGSAALASSVHLVCRPRENAEGSAGADEIGDWRDVLQQLPCRIHEWMPRLSEEGVVGADAIFACLGPALEIFSRYSRVEKASGEAVTLREYLEHVWAAVAKEALNMIFEGADATGFEEDARLTAMWLWTLKTGEDDGNGAADDENSEDEEAAGSKGRVSGFVLEYDAARKIAQGLGAHLEALTSVVEVKGETARLLPVAERTRFLFGKDEAEAPSAKRKKKEAQLKLGFAADLEKAEESGGWGQKGAPRQGETVLDRVHQAMILFAAGRGEALRRFLVEEGVGRDDRFWRLAQALSVLYPTLCDEKRWVDGVMARKKGLGF